MCLVSVHTRLALVIRRPREKSLSVHPSFRRLLLRVPSYRTPLATFRSERYLSRVSILLTTSPKRVHSLSAFAEATRFPTLVSFHPQAISASRWFSPRSGSQACFILQPSSGSVLFRGFSLIAAASTLRLRPAPLPLTRSRSWVAPCPHAPVSASRLFSATEPRCAQQTVRSVARSLPSSGLSLLQVPLTQCTTRFSRVIRS